MRSHRSDSIRTCSTRTMIRRRRSRPRAEKDYLQRPKAIDDAVNHRRDDFGGRRDWTPHIRLSHQGPRRRVSRIMRLPAMAARESHTISQASVSEESISVLLAGSVAGVKAAIGDRV